MAMRKRSIDSQASILIAAQPSGDDGIWSLLGDLGGDVTKGIIGSEDAKHGYGQSPGAARPPETRPVTTTPTADNSEKTSKYLKYGLIFSAIMILLMVVSIMKSGK